MNKQQIQSRALEYIKDRVNGVQEDVAASSKDGISTDEVDTFMGWFMTFEDFREWANDNWGTNEYMHLQEIFACIGKFLHC